MTSKVLCVSGGLDSSACWWVVDRPPWFFVPQANSTPGQKERDTVAKLGEISPEFAAAGKIIEFDMDKMRRPGRRYPRHIILASIGFSAGWDEVLFGLHKWDPQHGEWPKTEDGIDIVQTIMLRTHYASHDLTVRYPVVHLTRVEVVKKALENGCPEAFLQATWSCQRAGELHCGLCHNCIERFLTFKELGLGLEGFAEKPEEGKLNLADFTAVHAYNIHNTALLRELRKLNDGKPIIIDLPVIP